MSSGASTDGTDPASEPSSPFEVGSAAGATTRGEARGRAWLGPALGLVLVAAPAVFWGGAYVDVEALGFLQHYWGEGSFFGKVLDPRSVDYYRGRELSYAIDWVDAQWMRGLVERDVFFFLAPSSVLSSLTLVGLGLWLLPRALPALTAWTRWLGLLVLLSSFTFTSTMGIYYRSTKPVVAALLALLLLLVLGEQRRPRLGPVAGFCAVFATALAMSLLDRQGLFYVLLTGLALGVGWSRERRMAPLFLGAGAAVGFWYVYNDHLGPWLIHATNGYWPSLDYQRLRPGVLSGPGAWGEGLAVLGDWSSVALGGVPPVVLGLAAVAALGAWGGRERRAGRPVWPVVAAGLIAATAHVAMVVLMVERHPPVTWVSNRLWYYPLAYQVFLVIALLWGADRVAAARGRALSLVVGVAFGALVIVNLARWPELRQRMHSLPDFSDQWRGSRLLVGSLEDGAAAPPLLAEYRRFYFDCLDRFPHLAERAATQVSEGAGLETTQIQSGREVARARRESQIVPRTARPGPHVIAGGVILRPGDGLLVLLGAAQPRLIGEVEPDPRREGPTFFRFVATLGAGPNDVRIVSRLPEQRVEVDTGRRRTGFTLLLPVAVWETRPGEPPGERDPHRP